MNNTVPAKFIGEENVGYALLALLSDSTKSQIIKLLNQLDADLPGVLWLMPPEQLHITLCEIIQLKPYSQDKETLYKLHKEQYESAPAQILATTPPFTLTFDTVEASAHAIIIRSSDSTNLNAIRAKLVTAMLLPAETRTPPDITHSSIARYLQEIELEKVHEVVARHRIAIQEEVTEFKLVKNEIPPLQKYEVLRSYPLMTSR